MKEQTYEIENVAGITKARLTLKPGVNVLRGANGAGKTSAFRAIARAQGAAVEIECRDGASRGEIRGPGITLKVGKVVRTTGEAELRLADMAPLSQLIDPGFKDTDAAARARLRALVDLLDLDVNDEAVKLLCSGHPVYVEISAEIKQKLVSDLMSAAEVTRLAMQRHARALEEEAGEAKARAAAASDQVEDALSAIGGKERLTDLPVAEARQAVSTGGQAFERANAQCEAREALEIRQAALRESIGPRPDRRPYDEIAKAREAEIAKLDAEIIGLEKKIEGLREALAKRREEHAGKTRDLANALDSAVIVESDAERWDAAQEILKQVPEGPTREELEALGQKYISERISEMERAERSEVYRNADAERSRQLAAVDAAERGARAFRNLSDSIPSRLGEILASAGAPGLTVINGRIHALIEGKPVDWEHRLSDGQRRKLALDIAAFAYAKDSVVPLDGSHWAHLDRENREEIARLAIERELILLTEEPTEGELSIEHLGDAA